MKQKNTGIRASFTIEAALSLTMFILCTVVMLTPMLIFNQQQNASKIMEEGARNLSKFKYAEHYASESGKLKLDQDTLQGMENAVSIAMLTSKVTQPGMRRLDMYTESEVTPEHVHYVLNYDAALPFSFLGLHSLRQQVIASHRAWIGADGSRWDPSADAPEEQERETIVYVSTKSLSVYHMSRTCSYIYNDFLSGPAYLIDGKNTKYGGKFSPCQSCRPDPSSPLVYYTAGGKRYHRDPNCRAMQSYIQSTTLSKAQSDGRHACSRCG